MEDKILPVNPEEPIPTPEILPGRPILSKTLITVLLIVILGLVGIIIFLFRRSAAVTTVKTIQPEQKIITSISELPTITPTSTPWNTYTDTEAGFSLQYPPSVLLDAKTEEASGSVLLISADKLSSIPEDLPQLMGRNDVLKQKEDLLKNGGDDQVRVGTLNGQLGMTLAQFEICSVILTRSLTFYPGQYRVIISLAGAKNAIMDSMPDFFTVDAANCGTKRIWNQDKISTFGQTLARKKGRGAGQEWYDTFDAIIKTVTLTASQGTPTVSATPVAGDWLTYKNFTNGFEISYPKSYKALDGKSDLSGYPNGIVLIYSGGQAYDVVVEVWNTKSEYESNYASRLSDLTVVKSKDKFITIFNNTSSPENKKIISSLKLSP